MACRITVRGLSVDPHRCTRCGDCISSCPVEALGDSNGLPFLREPGRCLACLGCMAVCEPSALRLVVEWVCVGGGVEDTGG